MPERFVVSTDPNELDTHQPGPDGGLGLPHDAPVPGANSGDFEPAGAVPPPMPQDAEPHSQPQDALPQDSLPQDSHTDESAEPAESAEGVDSGQVEDVEPLELIVEPPVEEDLTTDWYILKVQVNREDSIRDALQRRVKVEGMDRFFKEIVVPTEDVAEFTKTGKRRVVKRKLYPGYIMVNMHINDETWFLVRETPGIGDFTGSAGKPTPMLKRDVDRILNIGKADDGIDTHVKTAIPFKQGDRVRVKDGYFQNFEGDVESVDEADGRVIVMINIFGRSTPVELEHWQIEAV
jgi:transcriptional antiterminator NusG